MAEGTNVGSIFIDLIVRNTVGKQVKDIAAEAQKTSKGAFSGIEKAAETAANKTAASAGKVTEKVASSAAKCAKSIEDSIGAATDKSVAMAQLKLKQLEERLAQVTAKRKEASFSGDDKATERFLTQQTRLYDQVATARERLSVLIQIAEEKQANAARAAAQKTVAAEEKAASRRKSIHAAMWKNMLSYAGKAAKSVGGVISGIFKRVSTAGNFTKGFGSRIREIVSGALIFNGISSAIQGIVKYMSEAVSSSSEMKQALSDLKGAAANAASPIIQVLTPALAQLTNVAATALSYIARLATMITGKVSTAANTATKSAQKTANAAKNAARSMAGFDQIEKLGSDSEDSESDSDSDSVEPNLEYQGKSPFLESLLAAINAGQWEQIGDLIAHKLNDSLSAVPWTDIQSKVQRWVQNLADTLNCLAVNVDWGLVGQSIGNGLDTFLLAIDTFFQSINWVELGSGIAEGLNGLLNTVDWGMLGRVLTDVVKALFELLHGFVTDFSDSGGFSELGVQIANLLKGAFGNIDWVQFAEDISTCIAGLFTSITAFIRELDWGLVGSTIVDCLMNINWGDLLLGVLGFIGSCFEGLYDLAIGMFEKLAEYCGEGYFGGMFKAFAGIYKWIKDHIVTPLVDAICNLLGIHSPSRVFEEIGENLIAGLFNGISETWYRITEFFRDVFTDMKSAFSDTWGTISNTVSDVVDGIQTKVSDAFTDVKDTVSSIFNSVKDTVTRIWDNISSTIKGAINGIIGFVNGMVSGIVDGLNAAIRALNKLSVKVPDWEVFGDMRGDTFGFNLQEISAPKIPYLADGGIIQQPTLAMVGEYPGARNDPEIVAPQSLMSETVAAVMEDVMARNTMAFEEVVSLLREILQAVLGIEIGDEVIGKAAARYNRRISRAGGY